MFNFTTNFFERQRLFFCLLILFVFSLVLFMLKNTPLIVDEVENFPQIINFTKGDYKLLEISAMPGYHAVMAVVSKVTGLSSLIALRCITVVFALWSAFVFYLVCNKINPGTGVIRTLQFIFLPSIFIYFFFLYTDILSLLLVLLMLFFALDKKFALAGLFGILSMMVRQNNIIWLAFIPVMNYYQNFGWKFSLENSIELLKKSWVFIAGLILFVVFVIVNKGVAVGDVSKHPFTFSTGNVFFMLFCYFLFFLPLQITNIPKVLSQLKSNKWFIPVSLLVGLLYWFTFKVDHPYNQIETHYFLRNLLLTRFTASPVMKLIFFLPVLYAFWSIVVTELTNRSFYFLYLFAILFLLPSWLIEQRYYIITFTLFLLFRKQLNIWTESAILIWFIVFLVWLMPMIASVKAFL